MDNALDVTGLTKTYGDFHLDKVSFAVPTGAIMGFVGQNGAGKTTTIRLILNMARREGGEIAVFGRDNVRDELAVKEDLGVVFDEIFFVDSWRVRNVEAAVRGFYPHWDSALFAQFLTEFSLTPTMRVKDLSRGMKMKLMLAVAMSHGAKLLILDEPTSGLDPVARDELLDILQTYVADGSSSVFFSTHITSDLERAAGYITLIDHGRIFYTGTKDGLLDHFRIVGGARETLTDSWQRTLIGVTTTTSGFTGLARVTDLETLGTPQGWTSAPPDIDEILIHISKDWDHD